MSISSDKLTSGEWNPTIYKGRDFKGTLLISINGVIGYAAGDTFEGSVTLDPESATGTDYVLTLTDPANGILTVTMPLASTGVLDIGGAIKKSLFHTINWTRLSTGRKIPLIIGRPVVRAKGKT